LAMLVPLDVGTLWRELASIQPQEH
jgi:hypothetical protein